MKVSSAQIGKILRREDRLNHQAIRRARALTSKRIVAQLQKISPVFDGHFKNAWQGNADRVWNDAPYAGVIERGARPHGVNEEGRAALTEWAVRKLGLDEKAAKSVVFGIVKKLREKGQRGLFLVENNLEEFTRMLRLEVERVLSASFRTRGGA